MNAPAVQTQGTTGNTHQESMMVKEGLDMNAQTSEARVRISQALGHGLGGKFLRVVTLGALLLGATALYFSISQGEAVGSPGSDATPSIDQRFPPGSLSEDTAGETAIFDEGVLPGRYREGAYTGSRTADRPLPDRELANLDYARTMMLFVEAQATQSMDQRFPPGSLLED